MANTRNLLPSRWVFIMAAVLLLALAIYMGFAAFNYGLGFPLDDAWIHQTYARNLAELGQWSFVPGQPSAGSTSPLWTVLQVPGQVLGLDPVYWSALLGAALLIALALIGAEWWRDRSGASQGWVTLAVALLIGWEWHLLWAALSGMEIIAAALVAVMVLRELDAPRVRWLSVGLLIGLGLWLRPDALSLLVAAVWVLVLASGHGGRRGAAVRLGAGLLALALPYLLFNFALSDSFWPTTFQAKTTEYGILVQSPLLQRAALQFLQPFIGVGAVLAPGLFYWLVHQLRARRWLDLAPVLWVGALLMAYAVRLPVTYQHGRYAMPVIPVILILSAQGVYSAVRPRAQALVPRVLSRAWLLTAAVSGLIFLVLGARAYARDVAIIETEMVRSARWIRANTEADALIAAHDIGALGYYGERRILDLAGLVSPEVIPFMRDEAALEAHLDQRGADYLMTFPQWYPRLVRQAEAVYRTEAAPSPAAGGENMVVYRW